MIITTPLYRPLSHIMPRPTPFWIYSMDHQATGKRRQLRLLCQPSNGKGSWASEMISPTPQMWLASGTGHWAPKTFHAPHPPEPDGPHSFSPFCIPEFSILFIARLLREQCGCYGRRSMATLQGELVFGGRCMWVCFRRRSVPGPLPWMC